MQNIDESDWIRIAFDCFNSHVKQRFLFINFYIIISVALLSSIYLINSQDGIYNRLFVMSAHFFEIFITYVFFKLDNRTKFLIKNSERVIKEIEKNLHNENLTLFLYEEKETKKIETKRRKKFICKIVGETIYKRIYPMLYSECFQLLFAGVAIYSSTVIVIIKYFT